MVVCRAPTGIILLISLAAPSLGALPAPQQDELLELIPVDAHTVQYTVADPGMDFFWDYWMEVVDAVLDADFDEFLFEVMDASGARDAEIQKLRNLRDMVASLVGSIDWQELLKNEVVYAESLLPIHPDVSNLPGLFPSMVLACRVDPDQTAKLESSLENVMAFLAGIKPDRLGFEALKDVRSDRASTNLYRILVDDTPFIQMAVQDETILLGLGQPFFEASLDLLEGRPGETLVSTERFLRAFGDRPRERGNHITYFDFNAFLRGMQAQVVAMEDFPKHDRTVVNLFDDCVELASCFESFATASHARDATVTVESWTRFDPEAARAGNPLFQACTTPPQSSNDLLAFVPASALAFSVQQGADLGPLYRWALDRVHEYVPGASDYIFAWELVQALADVDVETELLPFLGSQTVRITLPSEVGEDYVSVTRLPDTVAARKVLDRMQGAWSVIEERVIDELEQKSQGRGMLPKIRLRPAESRYPNLHTFSMSIPFMPVPMPELTYGIVGRHMITTTSDEALDYVMATMAGEYDGISEHPALQAPGLLPSGPIISANYVPLGRQMQQTREIVGSLGMAMTYGLKAAVRGKSERAHLVDAVTGLMPRIMSVLSHVDFLDDEVSYSEIREEGLVRYSRRTTRYVAPADRPRQR